MRFRVDRRLIDMSQNRKNQRDQTQPRYNRVGPQLFHAPYSAKKNHLKDTISSSQTGMYRDALFANAISFPVEIIIVIHKIWTVILPSLHMLFTYL